MHFSLRGINPLLVIKKYWTTLKRAGVSFIDDRAMKYSASLSYYTIFSLAPMLVVIISLCGIFLGRDAIEGKIYAQLGGLVGKDAALQIQEIIKNVSANGDANIWATVIGVITLVVGATGVFTEIQDSINSIWGLKAKPKRGWVKLIVNRLLSFSMVVSMGFLLLVTLTVNAVMDIIIDRLTRFFPYVAVYLIYGVNLLIIWIVTTLLFAIIFKVLPDGKVMWRDTLKGASFTAVLFMIGKFAIGAYLGNSNVASTYGAAGSIVIVLLWVYYSSIILYFGAEFTKEYAFLYGTRIEPTSYAVHVERKEVERETYTRPDPLTTKPL